MHKAGRLTPEQFWQRASEMDATIRAAFPTFPVYGLPAWPASRMLAERDLENHVLTTAGLRYGNPESSYVHVRTTVADPFDVAFTVRRTAAGHRVLDSSPSGTTIRPRRARPAGSASAGIGTAAAKSAA